MNLLDIVLFLPLVGFLLLLFVPKSNPQMSRVLALGLGILTFLLSLGLVGPYWFASPQGISSSRTSPGSRSPPIHYHVGTRWPQPLAGDPLHVAYADRRPDLLAATSTSASKSSTRS